MRFDLVPCVEELDVLSTGVVAVLVVEEDVLVFSVLGGVSLTKTHVPAREFSYQFDNLLLEASLSSV